MVDPIRWTGDDIRILDQTLLPEKVVYIECKNYQDVVEAIRTMRIRGAPAIGIAAAMGVALAIKDMPVDDHHILFSEMDKICQTFLFTRPTAVNLAWTIDRMKTCAWKAKDRPIAEIKDRLAQEAQRILSEDIEINHLIGQHGKMLIKDGQTILTHCNTGALATGGYGTALGIIRAAWNEGKKIQIFVDETRPALQGARLTAWELVQEGIPVTLITDNMAGDCMRKGKVDMVLVGADRITNQGDVANKIGTYSLAVMAKAHDIPFYVAAPKSTIDFDLYFGDDIPIEERAPEEVTLIYGHRIVPEGVGVMNPAFDVTPAHLVGAIITEFGIIHPPYEVSIKELEKRRDCVVEKKRAYRDCSSGRE